jgi:fido (protein-threonine AMPylation protein)
MPALGGGPSPHQWNQIKRLPLLPAIQTLEQYERAVITGTVDALAYLSDVECLGELSNRNIQQVHYQIFKGVHPWAGQFRRLGEMATVSGYPAADSQRIARELELAVVQTRELLDSAEANGNAHDVLAALAFFHVRFERVHPFLDGNGRGGRVILAVQFEQAFGSLPQFTDQSGYREAIRASARKDLGPFISYLGASVGLPKIEGAWPAPFQVAPRFLETEMNPPFEDDLDWSRS